MTNTYLKTTSPAKALFRWVTPGLLALLFLLTAIAPASAKKPGSVVTGTITTTADPSLPYITGPIHITITFSANLTGINPNALIILNALPSNMGYKGKILQFDITPLSAGPVVLIAQPGAGIFSGGVTNVQEQYVVVYSPTPTLSYDSPQAAFVGVPFNISPQTTNALAFTVDPALPAGLTLDQNSGIISGVPTLPSPPATYTVTAFGGDPTVTQTATVNIAVVALAPTISYTSPQTFSTGNAVNLVPVTTNATSFTVSPALPVGLTLDAGTGAITGSPLRNTLAANYTVTATGPSGLTATATVNITVKGAALTGLAVSGATLTKAFAANLLTYTANAAGGTTQVMVAPTATGARTVITVNGVAATAGAPVVTVPVTPGINPITVKVTLGDNITSQTYTVNVVVPFTNITSLTTLKLLGGVPLTGGAVSATEADYSATVTTPTTKLIAATTDPLAVIYFNGAPLSNNTLTNAIPLAFGNNNITFYVMAQDGVTYQFYVLNILRPSITAGLAGITLDNPSTLPAVTPGVVNYTTTVDPGTTSLSLTPTAIENVETILVNGVAVTSGTASAPLDLPTNPTVISINTTAQSGIQTKNYTLTVYKNGSNNALLSSFTIDPAGVDQPVSQPTKREYDYATTVTNDVTSVNVTPVVAAPGSVITLRSRVVASGAPVALPLAIGNNVITFLITAADGVTKTTYKYTVTRRDIVPLLASAFFNTSNISFSPAFDPNVTNYSLPDPGGQGYLFSFSAANPNDIIDVFIGGYYAGSVTGHSAVGTDSAVPITIRVRNQTEYNDYSFNIFYTTPPDPNFGLTSLGKGVKTSYRIINTTANNSSILVHPALSPNGDSHNDRLMIDGLDKYPENKLTVINRQGAVIYEAKNYDSNLNPFTGKITKTGKQAEAGTYFYSLQYKADGKLKTKTGYIVIKY